MTIINPPPDMLSIAQEAMRHAYTPYSHFAVGVCLRGSNGQLFGGCNVENAAYGLSLCAEANALSAMVLQGQQRWTEVLIISSGPKLCPPCGACRQRLLEFADNDSLCHLSTVNGEYQQITIKELLPLPFSSFNLESS